MERLLVENARDKISGAVKLIPPVELVSEKELSLFWNADTDWRTETTAILRDVVLSPILVQYEKCLWTRTTESAARQFLVGLCQSLTFNDLRSDEEFE